MKTRLLKILIFCCLICSMAFALSCTIDSQTSSESMIDLGQTLKDPDLENYYWEKTGKNTCTITGVKDTTVTDVRIPSCVTKIEKGVFEDCNNIQRVHTPSIEAWCNIEFVVDINTFEFNSNPFVIDGTERKEYADFYINGVLTTEVVIPKTVTKINKFAFAFSKVKSIEIPDSVTDIGFGAFCLCTNLKSITLPNSIKTIKLGTFFYSHITSIALPNSVTNVESYAFIGCTNLMRVVIGKNVTKLGEGAFGLCEKLVEVVNNSRSIVVEKGSTENGGVGFYALEVFNAQDEYVNKFTEDDEYLIYNCGEEKILIGYLGYDVDLVLPNCATKIHDYAFYNLDRLKSVTVGDGVVSIGEYAFASCDNITSIVIGENVTSIGESAFSYCIGLSSLTIPNNVTQIGPYAFSNVKAEIVWGDNPKITTLGEYVFNGYQGIRIKIPNSVTTIEPKAFYYTKNLISLEIGNNVSIIGDRAFYGCEKLIEVINKSNSITVTNEAEANGGIGYYALSISNCEESYVSKVVDNNGYVVYSDGQENSLVLYLGEEKEIVIPDYITKIHDKAFYSCGSIVNVIIDDSVTAIGKYAFGLCKSLTSIKYRGTEAEWLAISKGDAWDWGTGDYTITYNYTDK